MSEPNPYAPPAADLDGWLGPEGPWPALSFPLEIERRSVFRTEMAVRGEHGQEFASLEPSNAFVAVGHILRVGTLRSRLQPGLAGWTWKGDPAAGAPEIATLRRGSLTLREFFLPRRMPYVVTGGGAKVVLREIPGQGTLWQPILNVFRAEDRALLYLVERRRLRSRVQQVGEASPAEAWLAVASLVVQLFY